jgi:hypothetical protein
MFHVKLQKHLAFMVEAVGVAQIYANGNGAWQTEKIL